MKNIIVDTNILLLLIIGSIEDGKYIRRSTRLDGFDREDYTMVLNYLGTYRKDQQYITPYIATEISNLIDLKNEVKNHAFMIAKEYFTHFRQVDVNIKEDCNSKNFFNFGITDASLIILSRKFIILTNDAPLARCCCQKNVIPYWFIKQLQEKI